jgi:hypothetical protein
VNITRKEDFSRAEKPIVVIYEKSPHQRLSGARQEMFCILVMTGIRAAEGAAPSGVVEHPYKRPAS